MSSPENIRKTEDETHPDVVRLSALKEKEARARRARSSAIGCFHRTLTLWLAALPIITFAFWFGTWVSATWLLILAGLSFLGVLAGTFVIMVVSGLRAADDSIQSARLIRERKKLIQRSDVRGAVELAGFDEHAEEGGLTVAREPGGITPAADPSSQNHT